MKKACLVSVFAVATCVLAAGCGDEGGLYCCTYESSHTACGGGDWTPWETNYFEFNIDDYVDGWTPDQVCDNFSGTDTTCSDTCCIYSEDRNNVLTGGACPQ